MTGDLKFGDCDLPMLQNNHGNLHMGEWEKRGKKVGETGKKYTTWTLSINNTNCSLEGVHCKKQLFS